MKKINFYEFLGIMIGDGCLLYYPNHRIYGIDITGNAIEEQDYYQKIAKFLKEEFNLKPRIYIKHQPKGDGLKLIVYNKHFAELLLKYGITSKKTYNISIHPDLMSWDKNKYILRGIFETDGSLYFSKSKTSISNPSYPRLEIKTASPKLADQIVSLLKEHSFKVQSHQNGTTKVIYLSGEKMLNQWIEEIGFNSSKNWTKYQFWKKFGCYLPKMDLPTRIQLLNHGKS